MGELICFARAKKGQSCLEDMAEHQWCPACHEDWTQYLQDMTELFSLPGKEIVEEIPF